LPRTRDAAIAKVLGDRDHAVARGALCGKCAIAYNGAWRDPALRLDRRQAEVLAAKRMVERSLDSFALYPEKLIGDTAYGNAEMLSWAVGTLGAGLDAGDDAALGFFEASSIVKQP
jgi:hypothetical protein